MIYNVRTNSYVIGIHAPGHTPNKWDDESDPSSRINRKLNPLFEPLYQKWKSLTFRAAPGDSRQFSVYSFNNKKSKGILEVSIERFQIPLIVLGRDEAQWSNRKKISLLQSALVNEKREYVLIFDCFDVLIVNDMCKIVETFKKQNCEALFNCEDHFWPDFGKEYITENWKRIERSRNKKSPFLNSGMIIAKTKYLISILEELSNLDLNVWIEKGKLPDWNARSEHQKSLDSDQLLFHYAFQRHFPQIKLDSSFSIFLNIIGKRTLPDHILLTAPNEPIFSIYARYLFRLLFRYGIKLMKFLKRILNVQKIE